MDNNQKKHGMGGHMLMMMLCCLAPLILVGISKLGIPGTNGALKYLLPLLCPLMMVFMMGSMFKGTTKGQDGEKGKPNEGQQGSCH